MSKKQKYRDYAASYDPMVSNRTDKKQPESPDFISDATEKRDKWEKLSKQLQAFKNAGNVPTKVKP